MIFLFSYPSSLGPLTRRYEWQGGNDYEKDIENKRYLDQITSDGRRKNFNTDDQDMFV